MVFSFANTQPGVLLYNVLQLLTIFGIFKNEIDNPMPYSKFGMTIQAKKTSNTRVSSKIAMLIIYVPATIVAFIFQFILPKLFDSYTPTLAGWMVFAHFLKRDAEVLFLHKYSGDTEINTARLIGLSYAITALMICLVSNPDISNSTLSYKLGCFFFVLGELGNLYHHHLLALLRSGSNKKTGTKEYKAPSGGLFEYVATPHYFFELVAWFGIALSSEQLTSYLNFVSMTMYLLARAHNQNDWNKKKFDDKDWPRSRKNIIPFLY